MRGSLRKKVTGWAPVPLERILIEIIPFETELFIRDCVSNCSSGPASGVCGDRNPALVCHTSKPG